MSWHLLTLGFIIAEIRSKSAYLTSTLAMQLWRLVSPANTKLSEWTTEVSHKEIKHWPVHVLNSIGRHCLVITYLFLGNLSVCFTLTHLFIYSVYGGIIFFVKMNIHEDNDLKSAAQKRQNETSTTIRTNPYIG